MLHLIYLHLSSMKFQSFYPGLISSQTQSARLEPETWSLRMEHQELAHCLPTLSVRYEQDLRMEHQDLAHCLSTLSVRLEYQMMADCLQTLSVRLEHDPRMEHQFAYDLPMLSVRLEQQVF